MSKVYEVEVSEVHRAVFRIEADSPEDAVKAVLDADGEFHRSEYSHTLDGPTSVWALEEV